jgi:hypothetical protein
MQGKLQDDPQQPLIDLEDNSKDRNEHVELGIDYKDRDTDSDTESIDSYEYRRRLPFQSGKLSVKEWIVVSIGTLILVLLMSYLLYVLIMAPLLFSQMVPSQNQANHHDTVNTTFHERRDRVAQDNILDTKFSEFLIRDYIVNHQAPNAPIADPKVIQAAKLRTMNQAGFSSSEWLKKENIKYTDLFEYDINLPRSNTCAKVFRARKQATGASQNEWQEIAARIRNDPVHMEKMSKYKMYGAFLRDTLLIEIWINKGN